jgi:hypothetical protein
VLHTRAPHRGPAAMSGLFYSLEFCGHSADTNRRVFAAPAKGLIRVLFLEGFGGRTRARTWDPLIKSQLLYQLSYAPDTNIGWRSVI